MRRIIPVAIASLFAFAVSLPALGQGAQAEKQGQARQQEQVYGWELMTEEERNAYRRRMQAAETAEERERIRAEHHEKMQARAKEQGVTLPDEPRASGQGRKVGPPDRPPGDGGGAQQGRQGKRP